VTVSWFGSQNQVDYDLLIAPQNQRREVGTGHASRSSGLFHMEASRARVFQPSVKTGGGATAWMVHVSSLRRLHRDQVEDGWVDVMGCVGPGCSCFVIFFILSPRGIVVFLVF
jgi:hypothetical protein